MWLGGALNREEWFKHRFKEGQLLEGAIRDDQGSAQGTVLVRVVNAVSTDAKGHFFVGCYVTASDAHYRWWMTSGGGQKIRDKAYYHACEDNAHDCKASKGRNTVIHLEKFRIISSREWSAGIPAWAFKGEPKKDVEKYHDLVKTGKRETPNALSLPWMEIPEEEPEDDDEAEPDEEEDDVKARIKALRDELQALESKKLKPKGKNPAKVKDSKKDPKDASKGKEKKRKEGSSDDKGDKKKKRDRSPERKKKKEKAKKKKEEASSSGSRPAKKKRKKKRRDRGSSSSASTPDDKLFEKASDDSEEAPVIPKKGDRGPFGSGIAVAFKEDSTDEEDAEAVFRQAPVQQTKSSQLALMTYSNRKPGRLAARLLLKMHSEVALGSTGAMSKEKTPAVGVQYLLQIMLPQHQARMNLRTQRELRTLMVVLDHLARKAPARAADIICQRIKALERATNEGNWNTAQYLELIPAETATLLERDEEVYLTKEALLEMKLHGRQWERPPKKGKGDQKGKNKQGDHQGGKGKQKDPKQKEAT